MLARFFPLFTHFSPFPTSHPLTWRLPAANTIHLRHITTTSFSSCCTCYTPNGPRWMLTNCWTSFISLSSTVPSAVSLSLSLSLSVCLSIYLSVPQSTCTSRTFLCIADVLHFPFLFVNNHFLQYSISI